MSIRTRTVPSPGRVARRVQAAERVKSGAAQRAYAKRRMRAEQLADTPKLPKTSSAMAGRIPFVAAIIALLGCGLALTLLLTTRAAEDSYQLSDARQLNRKLTEERAALQREVEAADSAPELAARARELGMIPAKDPARLVIAPDGTVTVIGDPTPAQGAPAPPLNTTPADPSRPGAPQGERVVPVTAVATPQHPAAPGTPSQPAVPAPAPAPLPPVAAPPSPVPGAPAPQGEPLPEGAVPLGPADQAPQQIAPPAPEAVPAPAPEVTPPAPAGIAGSGPEGLAAPAPDAVPAPTPTNAAAPVPPGGVAAAPAPAAIDPAQAPPVPEGGIR
ncbi:hypothetical protein [Nocardia farcinica]|nr:hypothetical protein [Nocardia farcinica]MBF6142675.1 hypothetical protein [Nocardia farcinica]MBF6361516.1 hypothetical protein [Nocardia farcinica]MBF6375029.1 hypothetical protein [Nocardia farcinica]MBF6385960.1 hypothetical protein [Nocardia farcinica]MBF6444706.1 hypothetical protein [Nocardia farcinica]